MRPNRPTGRPSRRRPRPKVVRASAIRTEGRVRPAIPTSISSSTEPAGQLGARQGALAAPTNWSAPFDVAEVMGYLVGVEIAAPLALANRVLAMLLPARQPAPLSAAVLPLQTRP